MANGNGDRIKAVVAFIKDNPDVDIVVPAEGDPYVATVIDGGITPAAPLVATDDALPELLRNGIHFAKQAAHPHLSQWAADVEAFLTKHGL